MKRIGILAGFLILFVGIIVTLINQFGKQADYMSEFDSTKNTPTIAVL